MVEIFKTNVDHPKNARQLVGLLNQHFPTCQINFDLDDCDKILRVEGDWIHCLFITRLLNEKGFTCDLFPD